MEHVRALLIKTAFIVAICLVVLVPLTGLQPFEAILVGLIVTAVLYAVGDLLILPALGNAAATAADAGVAFLIVWLVPPYVSTAAVPLAAAPTPLDAALVAALIGVAEWFFHGHLQESVVERSPLPAQELEDS